MQGKVLHFDVASNMGVARGEDGNRYRFAANDWQSAAPAAPGAEIDFEVVDGRAAEIFVLKAAAGETASPVDFKKLRQSMSGAASVAHRMTRSAAAEIAHLAAAPSKVAAAPQPRLVADNWLALFAVASLAFCALPLLSAGAISYSLFGLSTLLAQMQDQLAQISAMFGGHGADANPWGAAARIAAANVAQTPTASFGFLLTLAYLSYLVPVSAAFVIVAIWRQTPLQKIAARIHAASCFLPLGLLALSSVELPKTINMMFGQQPLPSPFNFAGSGVWLLALIGVLQLAALRGLVSGSPFKTFSARAA